MCSVVWFKASTFDDGQCEGLDENRRTNAESENFPILVPTLTR